MMHDSVLIKLREEPLYENLNTTQFGQRNIIHLKEVKTARYDLDRCPRRGSLRPENPHNWHFSQPKLQQE